MTVMILWGRAADRIGRKPVMCASLFGSAITVSLFGFSKSFRQMIIFRCMAGFFAGSVVYVATALYMASNPLTAFQHCAGDYIRNQFPQNPGHRFQLLLHLRECWHTDGPTDWYCDSPSLSKYTADQQQ